MAVVAVDVNSLALQSLMLMRSSVVVLLIVLQKPQTGCTVIEREHIITTVQFNNANLPDLVGVLFGMRGEFSLGPFRRLAENPRDQEMYWHEKMCDNPVSVYPVFCI